MVSDTFAANALPATWLIGAVTFFLVLLHGALSHIRSPSLIIYLNIVCPQTKMILCNGIKT
jgi:hypothetical protein